MELIAVLVIQALALGWMFLRPRQTTEPTNTRLHTIIESGLPNDILMM